MAQATEVPRPGPREGRHRPASQPVAVRAAFRLALLALVTGTVASASGLLLDRAYGSPESTAAMLRAYDLVTLVVALPVLAVALVAVRRGSVLGRLGVLGMLAYLVYDYAYYLFGAGFDDLFLLHIVVFASSSAALVLGFVALDGSQLEALLAHRGHPRAAAAVLGLLTLGLTGMWVAVVVRFAFTGDVPAGSALVETDALVHLGISLDLALLVPAYAFATVLAWRRSVWGSALALVLLTSGLLHQVSYLVAMPFQAAADVPDAVWFDPAEPVILAAYVLALLLLVGRRARAAADLGSRPE